MLDNAGGRRGGGEEKETRFLNAGSFALLKFLMCMGYGFTFGALSVKEQERDEEEKMWIWTMYKCGGKSRGAGLVHSLTWKKQDTPGKTAAEIARNRTSRTFCRNKE